MPRQLRAIDGPLAGATWILKKRTRLGRAADSDIQIIHDGVSRQHARVVEVGPDEHEVVDLHSNNGTWIDNRRVDRCRLSPGDQLRIVGATFVYEQAPVEATSDDSAVYAVKVTSGRTLRRTMSIMDEDLTSTPAPAPTPAPHERDTLREVTPPTVGGPKPEQVRDRPERHHIVAMRPDGTDYAGNILSDVLEFRDLRLRRERQESLDPIAHRRLEALSENLVQPPAGALAETPDAATPDRRFCRFRVAFPARLRHGGQFGEATSSVMVVDLGAGGARVACTGHRFRVGELVWLVIDLDMKGRLQTFVLTSRVVKVWDSDHVGIIFAGAPEWDAWHPEVE
jgi:pSer/pThr/pTyr-binding forkhead associated (FHA) protein